MAIIDTTIFLKLMFIRRINADVLSTTFFATLLGSFGLHVVQSEARALPTRRGICEDRDLW